MNSLELKENSAKRSAASYASRSALAAEARGIFANLKNHLPFMAREGIVNGTYLAGTSRKNFGCIIQKLADAVDPVHPFHISQQNNGLIDLHAMRCAIGFCDTSRTLLKLVLLDKDNKTISNLLDKFIYSAVANFVAPLMLSYAGATALLQRLGQSLRMFPEINKFRKGDTKLSVDEMKFYLTKISESRSKSPTPTEGSDLDEKEDGISNEADMLVSILKKYYGTIPGEQAFAKSQDPQEHLDQCVSCGIPTLLAPRIVRDGWTTHAQHLEAFKNHIEALIKENTEGSKQELVQFISELLYVAANQSGVTLYEQNNSLQRSVSMEGRRLSGAIEASQRRGSVSAQLLQPQLQRLLSAKRNSNPDIIPVHEDVD